MKRVAVYSITRGKLELTKKSFALLRRYAGCDFDHYVADNASECAPWLKAHRSRFASLRLNEENLGQNLAANALLDDMDLTQYDYVLRWDPDAIPRTRRVVRKLMRVADLAGEPLVLSPEIGCLKHPPPAMATAKIGARTVEVVGMLGGICRLHPAAFFEEWRFNPYGALGFGEAAEVADRCTDLRIGVVRVLGLEVDHAYGEDGQAERWPEHFGWNKEVGRYVGYGL